MAPWSLQTRSYPRGTCEQEDRAIEQPASSVSATPRRTPYAARPAFMLDHVVGGYTLSRCLVRPGVSGILIA